ncbi:hypothetical protein ASPCAL13815 [Aspergillus calidoustus]|uniref:Uncharacterized protein n=1 Tax=Aspergillus calidoustus TaxID=454130 RepID=A0A0U5GHN6_ASPCI|nr:hypothetical protein ASPCAL13815 [Aspergillus calidoustus]
MGRRSKAKLLEEQETEIQERVMYLEKVQQLAKLRSGPRTICDCPNHDSYRMWCPTGDIPGSAVRNGLYEDIIYAKSTFKTLT